ncbi:uncharacterized protein LOC134244823 [Saccostrea cucullata]|uniref:uncharacterized protein LOC134244823 n=1 Tax=Saccostrea cuccullata TaxID=36930 RepID=UPI002ED57F8C
MSKQAISIQDSITVETTFGEHVIELCYGDITELPVEEKMDIVMVSAFIDDYTCTDDPKTILGALNHNLGIYPCVNWPETKTWTSVFTTPAGFPNPYPRANLLVGCCVLKKPGGAAIIHSLHKSETCSKFWSRS